MVLGGLDPFYFPQKDKCVFFLLNDKVSILLLRAYN